MKGLTGIVGTTVDTLLDEHYGDDEPALAMRFAALLNAEACDLAAAGADVIQFDGAGPGPRGVAPDQTVI